MIRLARSLFAALLMAFASVAVAESVYRIRPGDALRIAALRHPEYSQEVTVQSDGRISYFLIGEVIAAGKTPAELQNDIQRALAPQLTDAQVVVAPTPRENEVFVGGEVTNPNRYAFREPTLDVRRALVFAGDARTDSADLTRVTLLRKGEEPVIVDLTGSSDAVVSSGDAVIVGRRARIRIAGNAQKPDAYWVSGSVSAGYALALAGGVVDDKGNLTELAILRSNGSTETFTLDERFWADDAAQPRLSDGDALYVSNAYRVAEISVIGYVHDAGLFRVRGPVSVGHALALAGGAIQDAADMRHVEILRADGSRVVADLETEATTALVHPGDTVRVGKRFAVNWSFVLSVVSTATVVYSLIRQ